MTDRELLEEIAFVAHAGGLDGYPTVDAALARIRVLTLETFRSPGVQDRMRPLQDGTLTPPRVRTPW